MNVVSVGNYLEGFINNDMRTYHMRQNQYLKSSLQEWIPEILVIHIFFHIYSSPLQRMSNINHFGYLESILTQNFIVEPNTIEVVGGKSVEEK